MRKLILIFFLTLSQISSAKVDENLVYTSYTAEADPVMSLSSILSAATPNRQNGEIMHAYTKWYVKWQFRWQKNSDGQCKIISVNVDLTATINLPDLVEAEPAQQEQFDSYLDALRIHEQGHYSIGKETATMINNQILALPEMSDCEELESTANTLAHEILNEHKQQEREYDTSTVHGKTQGAWLAK